MSKNEKLLNAMRMLLETIEYDTDDVVLTQLNLAKNILSERTTEVLTEEWDNIVENNITETEDILPLIYGPMGH